MTRGLGLDDGHARPFPYQKGFAAVGLVRPKTASNVGSVLRAAYCYGASLVAIQGDRTPVRSATDTPRAYRHLPVIRGDDLHDLIPFDCVPVAVDLVEGAVDLTVYQHPARALYVFGPEDSTLGRATLAWCRDRVFIPTRSCLNLAAAVNVVLYDRVAKASRASRMPRASRPVLEETIHAS